MYLQLKQLSEKQTVANSLGSSTDSYQPVGSVPNMMAVLLRIK